VSARHQHTLRLVVAHRGASGLVRYGNTRESFEKAIEVGAPMLELDVRKTRDGAFVVYHDAHLGEAPLSGLDLATIREVSGLLGFPILAFAEALELCRGRIRVDVELKERGTAREIVAIARDLGGPDDLVFKSFHDDVVEDLREAAPEYPVGLLVGTDAGPLAARRQLRELFPERRLLRLRPQFVSPGLPWVKLGFVRRMHALGLPVWVWTVNDVDAIRRLFRAGVDAVITDRPDLALEIARENP
jgi:glycerophosphoryl diester phosphodiesterase